jgi:hypothetical protein
VENDQGVPKDFMDRRDLKWRNEIGALQRGAFMAISKLSYKL